MGVFSNPSKSHSPFSATRGRHAFDGSQADQAPFGKAPTKPPSRRGPDGLQTHENKAGSHQFLDCEQLYQDWVMKHYWGMKLGELSRDYLECVRNHDQCTLNELNAARDAYEAELAAVMDLFDEAANGQCSFAGIQWWINP